MTYGHRKTHQTNQNPSQSGSQDPDGRSTPGADPRAGHRRPSQTAAEPKGRHILPPAAGHHGAHAVGFVRVRLWTDPHAQRGYVPPSQRCSTTAWPPPGTPRTSPCWKRMAPSMSPVSSPSQVIRWRSRRKPP